MALDRPPGAGSASRLGNYELLRELSGGGIGSTWLARASSDEGEAKSAPPVTILRIYRHLTKKAETADSILREAGMAQQVRFPNVLSVLDARIADGEVFIVSEYVEGEPLGALVSAAGAEGLPPPVSLRIAIDVLRALASAHTAQPAPLVHGELSPTHVSVGIDGVTRVGGLGVARAIAGLAPMGTRNPDRLAYAAPDRVKAMAAHAEAPLDPRADLFSVGVVLWELLARQRLFSSKLEAAVIQKVQSAPIPPLAGLAGGAVPAEVVDVVQTALERDPARRFEGASAMLAALEAAGAGRIAGDEDVAAAVSRLAGKTIEPRRTMIAAAMTSPAGADGSRPPPRARGMTLVGVAIPAADGALSPRGESPRQAITAPSPRARANPGTPGAPPVAAGGAIAASQVRPTSGATATKDAAAPKNGLAAKPAAGAGASNGAGPAGTHAAHASIDTGWGSADDVPARDLPGPRRPAETLPRIELSGQGTEDRAAGASTERAAATGAATAKEQPPARPAAPRPGDPGDTLVATRATPTPAEATVPKPPTPAPGGPSPRPPRPPPPARAASPAQPETHGKVAAAAPAAVGPAITPSPPTPRVPVPPPAAATRRTPVVPAVTPAPRAAATPAPPPAKTTSRVPVTPSAPLPPAAPAPATSPEPSRPLPPAAPASATAPAIPVAAKTPPPPPAAAAPPGGAPAVAATQESARGNGPASTSTRTIPTPTGAQGQTKQWGRAASAVDQLGPGSTLGRYEILMPVAKGGMAAVWAARLQGTRGFRKIVAIKTMLPDVSDDPDFESMFLDEARVAARIRHPNVVEILDLGEEDDVLYIVMEWVDGETAGTLQKAAKRLGGIPQRIVLRIASQICAGLHNAHELRDDSGVLLDLVHRDISPANVLISTAGFVKIVDFGVAKSKGRLHVTRAGGIVKGKTPYLSPEQLGGLPIDRRSDIFSLGALLYVLTTGLHPFRAETELATIENITIKNPLPPRELNGGIHPELDRIILKALEKEPESRFSTCAEMQRAIDQVASTLGDPTTDEDVAAFVRQAIGEIQAKRAQELRDAIAAVDAGAAVNSERRPGASLEGHAALADGGVGSREGGPAAAASPPAAAAPAGAGPASSRGAASLTAAKEEEEPPVSLEPISFEEIAVPAQPAGVPPRLIIAPALQANIGPGELVEPVSPRPVAREGKPLGSSAKRILPAAGVPATKVLAAADPPASRAAALSARLARGGSRSLAHDVGEVTAVDRSFETGQRRKRLQLIVAGAAMFCVALGAVALVVRSGDERSRPEIGKARVDSLPAAAAADTTATAAEAVPAAPVPPVEPQTAQPASPPAPEASAAPPEAAPAPSPTPPAAEATPSQTAKAPAAATAEPIAAPQASRPPSTARPRTTSTPAKPAPKPATTGKPTPKKKYNPSGI